ncbi:MAG: hypothetical protein WBR29_00115 [Gammaproteobacteria bacterium]
MNHRTHVFLYLLLIVFSMPARANFFAQVVPQYDPGLTETDQFGISGVKVSQDGLIVVAATPFITFPLGFNDGQGSGYMYQFSSNQWTQTGQFISTLNQIMYGIGFALSKDGSTAIFGDLPDPMGTYPGEADFYAMYNSNPYVSPLQTLFDPTTFVGTEFGSTLALSGNGNVAVIGAPADSLNNGAAYIYTYNTSMSKWVQSAALTDPNSVTGYSFGIAAAVSADGRTALIGSYANGGTAYLYDVASGMKTREFDGIPVSQGYMALSSDGQSAIIASDSGVTVYSATDIPAWSGTPISITDPSGYVDMSADGDAVVIGTLDNSVYLYTLNSGSWVQAHKFEDPTTDTADSFGDSGVALSDDKETVAISAGTATVNTIPEAGAIYIFQSPADLSLNMTANPTSANIDQQVALDVTVTNNDTEVTAYNVTLTGTLPAGLTYNSFDAAGGSCSASGNNITCKLASLGPQAVWQPSATVMMPNAGTYNTSASVTSNQPDTDTTDNTSSVSVTVTSGGGGSGGGSSGGSGSGGGSSLDFFALGLLGVLLTIIQRRRKRH